MTNCRNCNVMTDFIFREYVQIFGLILAWKLDEA